MMTSSKLQTHQIWLFKRHQAGKLQVSEPQLLLGNLPPEENIDRVRFFQKKKERRKVKQTLSGGLVPMGVRWI
jgi:hypothetical protein